MKLEEAIILVSQKHPSLEIKWVDKGQMNFIAIVGDEYIYKFPKTPQ